MIHCNSGVRYIVSPFLKLASVEWLLTKQLIKGKLPPWDVLEIDTVVNSSVSDTHRKNDLTGASDTMYSKLLNGFLKSLSILTAGG